jgi:cytochrome c-type biogenesis protein CcmH/NrfF
MTAAAAATLVPLAHIGHWLWVFYVLPILVVVVGIVISTRAANRREREEEEGEEDGRR